MSVENVVIVGSGPAGFTAAIYAARAMLEPLLITGVMTGGQLMTTTDVENFPGYPDGVTGPKLMEDLQKQAERFGTKLMNSYVTGVDLNSSPYVLTLQGGTEVEARSIIVATGAQALWLDAEGEERLRSNGISTCATCDGAFFKGEELLVIGAGDSAMEEATFLTRYASRVTILHRREGFRASKIMVERARSNPKIHWKTSVTVKRWLVDDKGELRGALLRSTVDGSEEEIPCGGAFIAIGHRPCTSFMEGHLELDGDGYIVCGPEDSSTSVPGVFCCGDVARSSRKYKQAITAAGEGCRAAMDCEKWLEA